MKQFHVIFLTFTTCLLSAFNQVNGQFFIDAQLRNRLELRDGYQKLATEGQQPALLISQRTRMTLGFDSDLLKMRFTPQDVRIWGDQAKMSATGPGDNPSLDILEAFAELKLGKNIWVSTGRQQLVYDNKRLLGDRNWNQNSISYDALVLKIIPKGWNINAGASWNTLVDALSENPYPKSRIKSLNFLWINREINNHLKLSLLHISSGITKTDTTNALNFRHTTGFYGIYKKKGITAWGNGYYQYGKNQNGNKLSALLFDADISYSKRNLTTGAGLGYLSGNKKIPVNNSKDNLFDPLYGNRHAFFGYMDYFSNFPSHTKQGGLIDYYLYLDYKISKSIGIKNI
ncbi:MAG: alginate export family protein, partial [Bacteroidales bacterium]|nr:alginate export family protein [Bacteroidales bacterium]